jgi:hypothetical protein
MILVAYPGGHGGSYTIPASVTSIGEDAFAYCGGVTNVTIPSGVTNLSGAFFYCTNLTGVFFRGNAPIFDAYPFGPIYNITTYYLPGSTGWSYNFWGYPSGPPAVLWNPLIQARGANFGVHNNHFGFAITNSANLTVVVEACTNLSSPVWTPLQTVTLTNGSFYFSESFQLNTARRFYGLGFP